MTCALFNDPQGQCAACSRRVPQVHVLNRQDYCWRCCPACGTNRGASRHVSGSPAQSIARKRDEWDHLIRGSNV